MIALFLLATLAIGGMYLGKQTLGIALLLILFVGSCMLLWYHMADVLKINW